MHIFAILCDMISVLKAVKYPDVCVTVAMKETCPPDHMWSLFLKIELLISC